MDIDDDDDDNSVRFYYFGLLLQNLRSTSVWHNFRLQESGCLLVFLNPSYEMAGLQLLRPCTTPNIFMKSRNFRNIVLMIVTFKSVE